MKSRESSNKGRLVAEVLAGSWRRSEFPPLQISEAELNSIRPLLYDSGAAALAWNRLANTSLRNTASADLLHQAYRLQSLQSNIHEQKIEKVFRLLREAEVEAVLAKGWATAGTYNTRALRPFGDIDLCVRPDQFKLAAEILSPANDCWVDLHQHFSELADKTFTDLYTRSNTVALGAEQIRILGPEDQLALSAIHLLRHGAWRPLWLCDVGVGIESLPATFSWDVCLGGNATRAKWIRCAIGLAKQLLGADTKDVPVELNVQVPAWLLENVLKQWERPFAINQPPMSHPLPMANLLRHPSQLPEGLRQRWPNPILATISVNGEFNNLPRLPYQLANLISRARPAAVQSAGLGRTLTVFCMNAPIILSLDTATLGGSVWLGRGTRGLAARSGDPKVSQSATLLKDINDILDEAKLTLSDVELFACASGPGSFTGLRIGIATLKGLAASLGRPCLGVPTLPAVAHAAGTSPATVALLPAGRGEVFAQLLSVSPNGVVTELDTPAHLSPQKLLERYAARVDLKWAGACAHLLRDVLAVHAQAANIYFAEVGEHDAVADEQRGVWSLAPPETNLAQHVAALALELFQTGEIQSPHSLSAIYVRPSDAELNQTCR